MTAILLSMPLNEAACARLTHRQAVANIEADRAEWVAIARKALRLAEYQSATVLRDACAVLQTWGDATDYLQADAMIFALNKRERDRAHEAARRETSARIALRHLPRWPAVLAGAVAFTGFWWGVLALVMGVGG